MRASVPGPTVGVVGGGQLGRMLGEAAGPLGVEIIVADPTPDAPAAPVVRDQIVGGFDDPETLAELAERSDHLTFEIELADPRVLGHVSRDTGVPVHPEPETLALIEDKLEQNRRFEQEGIPLPSFAQVDTLAALEQALDVLGFPAMLKARRGGYDGRGNIAIQDESDVEDAFNAMRADALVEAFVPYERELSIIGCKGDDERALYPVTETIHEAEILRETVTPARTREAVRAKARELAHQVLDVMQGRGVYGIEMFEHDGDVLLNEVAPRPHNSGHWTIEGARTSQFEQHLRAVVGWPLGSTELRSPTVSANLLGDEGPERDAQLDGLEALFKHAGASLHWYGKRQVRPLRKMGHLTLTGDQDAGLDALLAQARTLRDATRFASEA